MTTLKITISQWCNNLNSISTDLSSFNIPTFKPTLDTEPCDPLKNVNYTTTAKKTLPRDILRNTIKKIKILKIVQVTHRKARK